MAFLSAARADFPVLDQTANGRPLVYLDSAATTQTPTPVLDAVLRFCRRDNANVHRGVHLLSQRATGAYEAVREKVRAFLNARSGSEIVFVRGTTEATLTAPSCPVAGAFVGTVEQRLRDLSGVASARVELV